VTVQVVTVGSGDTVTAVGVDPVSGTTVTAAGEVLALDALADVEGASLGATGQTLLKDADGQWRPSSLAAGLGVFTHTQDLPAAVWGPIAHNMGRYPVAWSLFDTDGRECAEYVVQHLDTNTLRVAMDAPTAGVIRLI
jgi:hypothetical protein